MLPAIMAVLTAINAAKSEKDADAQNYMGQANTAASPWTNAKGSVQLSKAPEMISQGVGTYYAMDREMERDKLAKDGYTNRARAMGPSDINPWSFGSMMMPNNYFGAQGSP